MGSTSAKTLGYWPGVTRSSHRYPRRDGQAEFTWVSPIHTAPGHHSTRPSMNLLVGGAWATRCLLGIGLTRPSN